MKVYGDAQAATSQGLGNQATAGVHENVGTVTWRALIRVAVKVNHSAHGPKSQYPDLPPTITRVKGSVSAASMCDAPSMAV